MSPSPSTPPISPSIAAQQVPLAQYAQAGGGAGQGGTTNSGQDPAASMGMVIAKLTSVGNDLEQVAKVLVIDKPELIPVLKQAVNALSMLMNEAQKSIQPDQGQATQAQAMPASAAVSAAA